MIQDPQSGDARIAALEETVRQLQNSPPLGLFEWLALIGSVLGVILAIFRIRDHLANRARVVVAARLARFKVRYRDLDAIHHNEHDSPPANAVNVSAQTSIEIKLELRNTGRVPTMLSEATLKTKHATLGTQEMKQRTTDWRLISLNPVRLEPGAVIYVTVHSLFCDNIKEQTIPGWLYLAFTDQKKRCQLTLEKQ